ncbi:hypothetical protein ACNPQM_05115 [Streptomyces sp. NPDC056231]|uniref:hypothetical protein n=1 Tax=Streptomyces sp. NPDC056231 TaxID=3345755 RepID=UPI003AAC6F5E
MINEVALVESQALRQSFTERTEALDRVKALSLLPDGMHVTTAMVAVYFEVAETVINNLLSRHREELESNGLRVIRGAELQKFKELTLSSCPRSYPQPRSSMALWPRRTVLNVAMLLRDSEVAQRVRTYLLDVEHTSRTHPVVNAPRRDSDVESLDARASRDSARRASPVSSAPPSSPYSTPSSRPPASSSENSSASARTSSRSRRGSSGTASSWAVFSTRRSSGPSPESWPPSTR